MLEVKNLSRVFAGEVALCDVSITLVGGTIGTILGANGAGKSTLLKLLAGNTPATVGKILWNGNPIRPSLADSRKQLMLLGESRTAGTVKASDEILQALSDYCIERDSLAEEVAYWFQRLNLVGTYGKSTTELSKGQRFKIAMISLFVVRPQVWLLDEPYSCGLDANGLEVLNEQLLQHRDEGGLVLFSSQWPEQALSLADHVLVLNHGRLVWNQTVDCKPTEAELASDDVGLQAVLHQIAQH